jgi:lysophospholipase L1-like esterase
VARFVVFALIAVVAAGCGGGDEPTVPPDPPELAAEAGSGNATTVAALGDSITAGNPLYDPDPDQRAALGFGDEERSQFEYWASQAEPGLELENCGVFGERTDEIAQRLVDCAEGADLVIVQGGINDIAQVLAGGPDAAIEAASQAAANIDGMLAEVEEMGLEVAVANVLPWNNRHPTADDPINRLNADIAEIAKRRGVPVLDFHGALEDPDVAGVMGPGLTDDGDHPSIDGYRILGELVADELG